MYVFGWTECLLLLSLFLLVFGPRFLIRSAQRMRRNLGGFKESFDGARGDRVETLRPAQK